MLHRLEQGSIRFRIGLLIAAILLPVAATLAWFLAADVRQAQAAARDRVRQLALGTARELQLHIDDTERVMAVLAAHPAVQAMDAGSCEPKLVDLLLLSPEVGSLSVQDLQGRWVCARSAAALPASDPGPSWQDPVAPQPGLSLGPVQRQPGSEKWGVALAHPIQDGAGRMMGRLLLTVDLLALNRHLFQSPQDQGVVTVVDARRTVALRSTDPVGFIGHQPRPGESDPAAGAQEGFVEALGRDGVPRLFAFVTLPRHDWRVAGSLPLAEVLAEYRSTRWRTLAIGGGLILLALGLGWRLSAAIVRPVSQLRAAAERVAAGDATVRSPVGGPPEVQAVARTFNRILEGRLLSESRLRGIFTAAMDAIITCDEAQCIVEANPAAARMFHCEVEDMIGSPLERFIPQRFRQAHRQDLRAFGDREGAARRMAAQREVMALRADGQEFPIEASISQLNVGGRRLYTVIHRDVTERRQAEQALRDNEARQRRLLAHLPEAVLVCQGDRVAFVNPAACQLFGVDAQALVGHSLLSFIRADSQPQVSAQLTHNGPQAPLAVLHIVRADGALRQLESRVTPVEYDGGHAMLIVLRDITELQRARAELESSHADLTRLVAELENIQEAERTRIARELHDDLQQTLAAIRMDAAVLGAAQTTGASVPSASPAHIERLAEAAIASTRRIINDLRPQVLEDCGLVVALETLAARFERRHGVRCSLQISGLASDEPPIGPATGACLYRVAQEALNNVAKHARASHVQLQLQQVGQDRVRLVVSDDGQGFAAGALRKPQSFGLLGMRERVRAARGTLQVDGDAGRGTTLTVELPTEAA